MAAWSTLQTKSLPHQVQKPVIKFATANYHLEGLCFTTGCQNLPIFWQVVKASFLFQKYLLLWLLLPTTLCNYRSDKKIKLTGLTGIWTQVPQFTNPVLYQLSCLSFRWELLLNLSPHSKHSNRWKNFLKQGANASVWFEYGDKFNSNFHLKLQQLPW